MVTGEIEAKLIDVRGVLSEKIVCQEHMVIHRTGLVSGHLDYMNIEIERGGQFEGQMVQHPSSVPVVEDEPAHSAQQAPV
jgi:cytoskeletal protein CcmA (bactofilin family)